ncbi:hypothetical protein CEUSTIGMA_g10436.t1 [Chlamydomonas eustigma]|uniref:U-box domain-containing protein n=1 Tax=Chlamydomonas eustigma TaxID=1157962 RepID=A0A250XJB5_9CHLO|nr:hypothetical protein CEUSTIGMA_g10436.t1 [Chlamydomonas eustigma]|eukprot:GAX83009.1 hypothetical protein CEUSTIGMA_g10436.t1 [Chlamydomonas eustigma]
MGNITPSLHQAASRDDISALCVEIQQHPARINELDDQGRSALIIVCSRGFAPSARELLRRGAIVDITDKDGRTALHHACMGGHVDCVQALLQPPDPSTSKPARNDLRDKDGRTCYEVIRPESPHASVVAALLGYASPPCLPQLDHKASSFSQDRGMLVSPAAAAMPLYPPIPSFSSVDNYHIISQDHQHQNSQQCTSSISYPESNTFQYGAVCSSRPPGAAPVQDHQLLPVHNCGHSATAWQQGSIATIAPSQPPQQGPNGGLAGSAVVRVADEDVDGGWGQALGVDDEDWGGESAARAGSDMEGHHGAKMTPGTAFPQHQQTPGSSSSFATSHPSITSQNAPHTFLVGNSLADVAVNDDGFREEVPELFLCAITRDIMRDPVNASDGHTYERSAITQWMQKEMSSPMTKLPLQSPVLYPNHNLRSAIIDWVTKNRIINK